jgi:hypothetical protein
LAGASGEDVAEWPASAAAGPSVEDAELEDAAVAGAGAEDTAGAEGAGAA